MPIGKHSKDYKKNLAAAECLRKGDKRGAARILETTSKENRQEFIRRVRRNG